VRPFISELFLLSAAQMAPHPSSQPAQKEDVPSRLGRSKDGLNSKPYLVCDEEGKPLILLLPSRNVIPRSTPFY
jgi:hypothetical protein